MPILCVIPARLGSTRLSKKPLRLIGGEPMVRVVARRVREMGFDEVVVATDDESVAGAVAPIGINSVLTDPGHRSGTERVAEVVRRPEFAGYDVVLNVQGDEPFLPAAAARGAVDRVLGGDEIGTAAVPLGADAADPARVKVIVDGRGRAVAFQRTLPVSTACHRYACFQHLGAYAFTRRALERWMSLPPVPEELDERLEQLRPLAHGISIGVAVVNEPAMPGIDTEDDLMRAEAYAATLTAERVR